MALIECPECKHNISDRALACPSCGLPLSPLPAPCQPVATQELPRPTDAPTHLQKEQPSHPQRLQPEPFLFGKIYAGVCFFGCAIAGSLGWPASLQIIRIGDWLNNTTTQRSIGQMLAMIFLIALWSTTGWAIICRKRRAITLCYVGAVVAVVGVIVRGIIPLDIMLAIPTFAIIQYLRKRSAFFT